MKEEKKKKKKAKNIKVNAHSNKSLQYITEQPPL